TSSGSTRTRSTRWGSGDRGGANANGEPTPGPARRVETRVRHAPTRAPAPTELPRIERGRPVGPAGRSGGHPWGPNVLPGPRRSRWMEPGSSCKSGIQLLGTPVAAAVVHMKPETIAAVCLALATFAGCDPAGADVVGPE